MKLLLTGAIALTLGACTSQVPEPIYVCDYIPSTKGLDLVLPEGCEPAHVPLPIVEVPTPTNTTTSNPDLPVSGPEDTPEDTPEGTPTGQGNNGLGNGDQTAPGNSGDHNRAENENGNPGHASGKPQNSN